MSGETVVGFVARGSAKKLKNLWARRGVAVVFQSGWEWVTVEGDADLAGPDDTLAGLDASDVARVLREIYAAAVGGTHDDWAALDGVFATERHTTVLIHPLRIYSNPGDESTEA